MDDTNALRLLLLIYQLYRARTYTRFNHMRVIGGIIGNNQCASYLWGFHD